MLLKENAESDIITKYNEADDDKSGYLAKSTTSAFKQIMGKNGSKKAQQHISDIFGKYNIDLSECTYFRFNPMGGSLKKLSFKNKTFNKSLNNSTSNGTFHNILYTSNTGTSPIEELNFDNIVVNSTNTYFGEINNMSYARAYSSKGIHFLGRNMRLNNVTNFNFLNIGDMIEVDLSESYMPKVHTLSISSTSAYSNAVKRLRTIKLNGITMPNLATLSSAFSGNIQLRTIEMEGFGTTKVTNMSSAFASCEALTSLDLSS
jgi:surface protein